MSLGKGKETPPPPNKENLHSSPVRNFNVSVVGLSGTEKDKGAVGVGKSCLCNRFVRPLEDDYYTDHISTLSQVDFGGRVINNDHWLYWGERQLTGDDGVDMQFRVVEQTEFLDDESFQPIKSNNKETYNKRCATLKLHSPDKLMYIWKNQLALEHEYEQRVLPEGRITIDGFICVFDVSSVPSRSAEQQLDAIVQILMNINKAKKPVVIVTTKNDESEAKLVREVDRLLGRRELKGSPAPPVVESSAHKNVNVELGFTVLAQLIDTKSRAKPRLLPYLDAARSRKEIVEVAQAAYVNKLRQFVSDHRVPWGHVVKQLGGDPDFEHFCELSGRSTAQKLYRAQQRELRQKCWEKKLAGHIQRLPEVFDQLLPDLQFVQNRNWNEMIAYLPTLPSFNRFFLPPGSFAATVDSWPDSSGPDDNRIPPEVFDTNEAKLAFQQHLSTLENESKRVRLQEEFAQLLSGCPQVTPGKPLGDVRIFFLGQPAFEALPDADLQIIYDRFQRQLVKSARREFSELLLENVDEFVGRVLFREQNGIGSNSSGRSGFVPGLDETDMQQIHEKLQEDSRYRQLNRLHRNRDNLICQYVGFISYPLRQHCPAQPRCNDELVENLIANRIPPKPYQWTNETLPGDQFGLEVADGPNWLNFLTVGTNGLAERLASEIHNYLPTNEFVFDNRQYQLSYQPANCDLSQTSLGAIWQSANSPIHGLIGIFSSRRSFDLLSDFLTHSNFEDNSLPIVLVLACDPSHIEDLPYLQQQAINLAQSFAWGFVGVTGGGSKSPRSDVSSGQLDLVSQYQLQRSLDELVNRCQHRMVDNSYNNIKKQLVPVQSEPDMRILICLMCGDDFSPQLILNPLLNQSDVSWNSSSRTVTVETFLPSAARKLRICLTVAAYHTAFVWVAEGIYFNGYQLVYSTKRRASLAHLDSLAHMIPDPIPILMVAVGEVTEFFSDLATHQLITEGNEIADRISARFITLSKANSEQSISAFTPFFEEVWQKLQTPAANQSIGDLIDPNGTELPANHKLVSSQFPPDSVSANFALHFNTGWPPANPEDSEEENCGDHVTLSSFLLNADESGTQSNSTDFPSNWSRDSAIGASMVWGPTDSGAEVAAQRQLPYIAHLPENLTLSSNNSQSAPNHMSKSFPDPTDSEGKSDPQRSPVGHSSTLKKASSQHSTAGGSGEGWLDQSSINNNNSDQNTPVSAHSGAKFKPGRLNLTQFTNVTEAIGRQKTSGGQLSISSYHSHNSAPSISPAPLATPEHIEMANSQEESKLSPNRSEINSDPMQRSVRFPADSQGFNSAESTSSAYERFGRRPTPHRRVGKEEKKNVSAAAKFSSIRDRIQLLNSRSDDSWPGGETASLTPTPPPVPPYSRDRLFPARNQPESIQADKVLSRLRSASQDSLDNSSNDFWSTTFVRRVASSFRFGVKSPAESVSLPQSPVLSPKLPLSLLSPQGRRKFRPDDKFGIFVLPPVTTNQQQLNTDDSLSKDSSYDYSEENSSSPRDWLNESVSKGQSKVEKSPKKEESKKDRQKSGKKSVGSGNSTSESSGKISGFSLSARSRSKKSLAAAAQPITPAGPKNLAELSAGQLGSVPLYVRKCVDFVEAEGLNAEGIYRVPGNQVHVAMLEQKFAEDSNVSFAQLDLPVNAVATGLKNFFSTLSDPVVPTCFYDEIIEAMDVPDRMARLELIKAILSRLPPENFDLLRYFLNHLRRVARHSVETSMDQRNLAKCWWPTLLRPNFDSFELMAQMTSRLEEFVQLLLEHFDFLFS